MLPRVCTRWAHILRQPSAIWEDVDIDLEALYKRSNDRATLGRPPLAVDVVSTWFGRSVVLSSWRGYWSGVMCKWSRLPMISVLCTQARQLRSAALHCGQHVPQRDLHAAGGNSSDVWQPVQQSPRAADRGYERGFSWARDSRSGGAYTADASHGEGGSLRALAFRDAVSADRHRHHRTVMPTGSARLMFWLINRAIVATWLRLGPPGCACQLVSVRLPPCTDGQRLGFRLRFLLTSAAAFR